MEPRTPEQPRGPEQLPTPVPTPEQGGEALRQLPERESTQQDRGLEQSAADARSAAMPATPVLPPPVVSQPTAVVSAQNDDLQAADEDLIEKEWVDKLKKVITETKDDPHAREMGIAALQREYLQKRYNKTLGAVDQ